MPVLTESVLTMNLPKVYYVKQSFDAVDLRNVREAVNTQIMRPEIRGLVRPAQKIALAVGSRGIHEIDTIVRQVGESLKTLGAVPFIVPAMGSHGGATAEGQLEVLANYGITEDAMGMPVISSMAVKKIGQAGNIPVLLDEKALAADLIVPIARVKPHTDFKGPIESGLCKMLAIGLGKHEGCSRIHQEGFINFREAIPRVAKVIIENAPIGFGIAIVENAVDHVAMVQAVVASDFLKVEPEILEQAKQSMARLLFSHIDVLIVDQIGKEISGAGMDPNVTGRASTGILKGFKGPKIQRIVVLGLSDKTHGNAAGIGSADFTTRDVFENIDFQATYANVIASSSPEGGRLPVFLDTKREAILAAIKCCNRINSEQPKIVRIKNTLELTQIIVSASLLPEVESNSRLNLLEEAVWDI